ncbi:MAG: DUF1993 domain-containing protein [Deltaproteobacteria bacterium]|nr:DUF1993 domain-containing protein [Deltaproteobacteria bacterium]MBW2361538.1 DUF1993 domain-containing protein [Deltaproteobacteria bacterium]
MTISIYDQTIPPMSRALTGLAVIVAKAEAHADEQGIEHAVLLNARLFPNMRGFIEQIQMASDTAKGGAARLARVEIPSWQDDEASFSDVRARIQKTLDFLAEIEPEALVGADSRTVEMKYPGGSFEMEGKSHLLDFVVPNLYFHITTAYNILRHNGVEVGKRDYLSMPEE